MQEKVKEIVSLFIKLPAGEINEQTAVGRSAVSSSIVLHRMYAKLAEEGFLIENYTEIQQFGQLFQRVSGESNSLLTAVPVPDAGLKTGNSNGDLLNIGIDIEEIALLPQTNDFRKDAFYSLNFAPSEISYCILQKNPYASFAGLFAAKEAIIKSRQ